MFGFKSRKQREAEAKLKRDIELAKSVPRLHGFRLDEWHYLGRSRISINFIDTGSKANANVFCFCWHDNTDKRSHVIIPEQLAYVAFKDMFDRHQWVTTFLELWKSGEYNLWEPVNYEPSRWLKDWMHKNYALEWSYGQNWWVDARSSSNKSTATNRKSDIVNLIQPDNTDCKVITVDFSTKTKKT